jgi:hypothetical protein
MLKKIVSIVIAMALVNLLGASAVLAGSNSEKELRQASKVKENIQKLGTGESAKVRIKLKDKTKIEGYVSGIGEDSFTVTDAENGLKTEVGYSKVKKVKGNNLSTGAKIAIGAGLTLAAVVVIAVLVKGKVCTNALCR